MKTHNSINSQTKNISKRAASTIRCGFGQQVGGKPYSDCRDIGVKLSPIRPHFSNLVYSAMATCFYSLNTQMWRTSFANRLAHCHIRDFQSAPDNFERHTCVSWHTGKTNTILANERKSAPATYVKAHRNCTIRWKLCWATRLLPVIDGVRVRATIISRCEIGLIEPSDVSIEYFKSSRNAISSGA